MKIKKLIFIKLALLLVFGLLHLSMAEENLSPLEKAKKKYRKANEAYTESITARSKAYENYNETHKVQIYLQSVMDDIELENKENWEDIRDTAKDFMAQFAEVVVSKGKALPTSLTATTMKLLSDVKDWKSIKDRKSNVERALISEEGNVGMLYSAWQAAIWKQEKLRKEKNEALSALEALESLDCTLESKDGSTIVFLGDSHTASLTASKNFSQVDWYLKSSKGTLHAITSGPSKTDERTYTPLSSGDHEITVKVKTSSGETATKSYTFTVLEEGVFFNETSFRSDETLIIDVVKEGLYFASIYTSREFLTRNYTVATGNKTSVQIDFSKDQEKWKNFSGKIWVYVHYYDSSKNKEVLQTSLHIETISVQGPLEPGIYYDETSSQSHSVTLITKGSGYSMIKWYLYGPNDDGDFGKLLDTTYNTSPTLKEKGNI